MSGLTLIVVGILIFFAGVKVLSTFEAPRWLIESGSAASAAIHR